MKKLIPALALLLVSAVMLATSSFAWFSMNTTVTVTGMSVSTRISDNLQIADDALNLTAKKADNLFQNGLNQTVTGILEPVSTADGVAFFYTATDNVYANGDAITDVYIAYNAATAATDTSNYNNKFSENYDVKKTNEDPDTIAVAYVDYVFQIKAINSATSGVKNVKLTGVNLLYNNLIAAGDNVTAFRVAVFAEKYNEDSAGNAHESDAFHAIGATYDHDDNDGTPEIGYGKLVTILAPAAGSYRTDDTAVNATSGAPAGAVQQLGSNANIGTVAAGTTAYFKVVVRLWLEGEDPTCNSQTYLSLTKDWTLDLKMDLGTGDGADEIGSDASAVATASTTTASVTLDAGKISNGETPASYQWKLASDNSNIAGATNATYTNDGATRDVYCVITTTRGSIYTTNTVEVEAPAAP